MKFKIGACDCIIEQDPEANTISMWLQVEPHEAAMCRVGATVIRGMTENDVTHRWRVVGVDEPAGRIYVVPLPGF